MITDEFMQKLGETEEEMANAETSEEETTEGEVVVEPKIEVLMRALEEAGFETSEENIANVLSALEEQGMEIEIEEDSDIDAIVATLVDFLNASASDEEENEEHMEESVRTSKKSITEGFLGNKMFDEAIKKKTAVRFPQSALKNIKVVKSVSTTQEEMDEKIADAKEDKRNYDFVYICSSIKKIGPFYSGVISSGLHWETSVRVYKERVTFKATIINNSISKFVVTEEDGQQTSFSVDMKNFKLDTASSREDPTIDDGATYYNFDKNESVKSKKKKIIKENTMNFGVSQLDKLSRSLGAMQGLIDSIKGEEVKTKFNKIWNDLDSIVSDLSSTDMVDEEPIVDDIPAEEPSMEEEAPEVVTEPVDEEIPTEDVPAEETEEKTAVESRRYKKPTITESASAYLNNLDWK